MTPLPQGRFGAILADPPWSFRTYGGGELVPTIGDQPYAPMNLEAMKLIPVESVAADDCLMVMWVISSHVPQAIELGAAWGFTYRSIGPIWTKERFPTQSEMFDCAPICDLGMGYWFRQQAEISFVFGRGSPKRLSAGVRQIVGSPRREHSRKPDEVHSRIEQLVHGPYLELFGRQSRPGWAVWGNEADKFDGATNG